jgi:RimJ/RimL family protein N-acetyltransferase
LRALRFNLEHGQIDGNSTPMPMNALPIDTPSLRLRHIVVDEAARMMELNGEPSTRRWLPSHVYADVIEATSRMQYLTSCYSSPGNPSRGPYVLAVEHLASGALLGHVGFSPFDDEVEVSYAIAESSRGRGYGSEALLHACQWAAQQFGLASILAITEIGNEPSRRTLGRAAFVHDRDMVMQFQGSEETVSCYLWRPFPESTR